MRHPLDTVVISGALWLLAAMLIDALTPKDLNVYMVGAALAPATIIGAVFYHRRLPGIDLAITLAALWLASTMAIECISPKPLSLYFMTAAVAPAILVGIWFHCAARRRRRTGSHESTSA